MSLINRLKSRWHDRLHYLRRSDWVYSIIDRLLRKPGLRRLPLAGKPRQINLKKLASPLEIRLGTTDWLVVEELFFKGEYDALKAVPPESIKQIVDLGANAGYSIRLWRDFFPDAKVIAVEPEKGNVEAIRRNLNLLSRSNDDVQIVEGFVAGERRKVTLDRTGGEWGIRMNSASDGDDATMAFTLDEILTQCHAEPQIDLLKCDIEGAEREVFEHCASWIGRVANLYVELHLPYTAEEFLAHLKSNGGDFVVRASNKSGEQTTLFLQSTKAGE